MKTYRKLVLAAMAFACAGGLAACEEDDETTPFGGLLGGGDTMAPMDGAVSPDASGTLSDGAISPDAGAPPPWEDHAALTAWVEAVAAGCPPVSLSTAPVGWSSALVTPAGCTVKHPPDWTPSPSTGLFMVTNGPAGLVGWLIAGTWVQGTTWTVETLGDHLVEQLRVDHPDLVVVNAWTDSATDPFGVTTYLRTLLLRFTQAMVQSVGLFKVVHTECSVLLGACPLTASGAWAPVAELPTWACTLAQVEATFYCPSGGGTGCDEGQCDATCKEGGSTGGTCVGDQCTCY